MERAQAAFGVLGDPVAGLVVLVAAGDVCQGWPRCLLTAEALGSFHTSM